MKRKVLILGGYGVFGQRIASVLSCNTDILVTVIARNGDGPYVPSIPSVILAQKILDGQITKAGAYTAAGLITRAEILRALRDCSIEEVIL